VLPFTPGAACHAVGNAAENGGAERRAVLEPILHRKGLFEK
jgi:hypothetical protein